MMNMIMCTWALLLIGLVCSASAVDDQVHHVHHDSKRQVSIQYSPDNIPDEIPPATECTINGVWYNQLGSEMILNVTDAGLVTGEYRTGVERKAGAAGKRAGIVTGWTSPDGSHMTVSLSVLWNNGTSVSAWTGLCHVCNEVEIIKTTWLLTSEVDSCGDHWSSNRIGHDDFTRFEQTEGPRRYLNVDTPSEFAAAAAAAAERTIEEVNSQEQQEI